MNNCGCEKPCGEPMLKRVVVQVATFDDGATETSAAVVLWLQNPSVQLSCMVALVPQVNLPVPGGDPNTLELASTAVWQFYPALPPLQPLIQPALLQPVFVNAAGTPTARALPDGYTIADPQSPR